MGHRMGPFDWGTASSRSVKHSSLHKNVKPRPKKEINHITGYKNSISTHSFGRVWNCHSSQCSFLPTFASGCFSLSCSQIFSALCQVCNLKQNGQRVRQNAQQQQNPSLHWLANKIKGERRREEKWNQWAHCSTWGPANRSSQKKARWNTDKLNLLKPNKLLTSKYLFQSRSFIIVYLIGITLLNMISSIQLNFASPAWTQLHFTSVVV